MKISIEKSIKLIKGIMENTLSFNAIKELLNSCVDMDNHLERDNKLEFIYCLSYFFLDENSFKEISAYIKDELGIMGGFSWDSYTNSNLYWLWQYCNGDEETKRLAVEKINFGALFSVNADWNVTVCLLTGSKSLCEKIFNYVNYCEISDDDDNFSKVELFSVFIDEFFLYAANNKDIRLLENLIACEREIKAEYQIALAIECTDFYYDFFGNRHPELLPKEFIGADGKIMPLNKLVSVLFSNGRVKNMIFPQNVTVLGILCDLSKIISIESIKKVEEYIPKIEYITNKEFNKLLLAEELNELVLSKAGNLIYMKGVCQYGFDYSHTLKLLGDFFKNSRVCIEINELFFVGNEMITYKFLSAISKYKMCVVFDTKKWVKDIEKIVELNSERIIKAAVKIGIINKENYEQALETAVEMRAVKAIKELNSLYDKAQKKEPYTITLKKGVDKKEVQFFAFG